jgi:hypothetical protein
MRKTIILISIISLLVLAPVTSALELQDFNIFKKDFWTNAWDKTKTTYYGIVNSENFTAGKIFGFETPWGLSYLFIGFLAGIYLYLFCQIQEFIRKLKALSKGNFLRAKIARLKDVKGKWIKMIASNLWKVVIIAVIYFVLMQIPIINRLIQIITLDIYLEGIFFRSVILAAEIGFLPHMVELLMQQRTESNYQRAVTKAVKATSSIED